MYSNTKAQQIAAGFLSLAPGGRLSKMALVKLMYIADRTAIKRYGATMSDDTHYSLQHGPILSNALNAINQTAGQFGPWSPMIDRDGDFVVLREQVQLDDLDELSEAEADIIAEISAQFDGHSASQLRNHSHDFPEWQDPGTSRLPISFADIARAVELTEAEIQELEQQRQIEAELDRILVAG